MAIRQILDGDDHKITNLMQYVLFSLFVNSIRTSSFTSLLKEISKKKKTQIVIVNKFYLLFFFLPISKLPLLFGYQFLTIDILFAIKKQVEEKKRMHTIHQKKKAFKWYLFSLLSSNFLGFFSGCKKLNK